MAEISHDESRWANWRQKANPFLSNEISPTELEELVRVSGFINLQKPTDRESPRRFYGEMEGLPQETSLQNEDEYPLDIFLSQHVEREMTAHLDAELPNEAIGFMLGRVGSDQVDGQDRNYIELKEVISMHVFDGTAVTDQVSSMITYQGIVRAMEILEGLRRQFPNLYQDIHIIGWYHQHPLPASMLSQMDNSVHFTLFNEPYHIACVRNSSESAPLVFHRASTNSETPQMEMVRHFRQTEGYLYNDRTPVAYDIEDFVLRNHGKAINDIDIDSFVSDLVVDMQTWLTPDRLKYELQEIIRAVGQVVLTEMIASFDITITEDDLENDGSVITQKLPEGAVIILEKINNIGGVIEQLSDEQLEKMVQVSPEADQISFRAIISNSLISLSKLLEALSKTIDH